jgi:hypothetical protein
MDFPYLTKVVKLNTAALAALASAPPPPEATVEGAVSTDTVVDWSNIPGVQGYVVRWRRTDSPVWTQARALTKDQAEQCIVSPGHRLGADGKAIPNPPPDCSNVAVLQGIRVDDWVFGVSSVGANGFESPVASAVPGGAFKPYVPPPPPPAGQ